METQPFSKNTIPAKAERAQPSRDTSSESVLKQKFDGLYNEYKIAQAELKKMDVDSVLTGPTHENKKVLDALGKLGEITALLSALDETLMEIGMAPNSPIRSELGREFVKYRELMQKSHDTHEFNRTASALKIGKIEEAFHQRGQAMDEKKYFFEKGSAMHETSMDAQNTVNPQGVSAGELAETRAYTIEDYEKQFTEVDEQLKESRSAMNAFIAEGKVKEMPNGMLATNGLFGFLNRGLAKEVAAHNALLKKQQDLAELVIPRASAAQGGLKNLFRGRTGLSPVSIESGKGAKKPVTETQTEKNPEEVDEFTEMAATADQGKGVSTESLQPREELALSLEDYEQQLSAVQDEIASRDKILAGYGSAVGRNKDGTIYRKFLSRQPSKAEVAEYNNLIKKENELTDLVIPRASKASDGVTSLRRRGAGLSSTTIESGENATHKSSETALEYYSKPFEEARQKQEHQRKMGLRELGVSEARQRALESRAAAPLEKPNFGPAPLSEATTEKQKRRRQRASLTEPTATKKIMAENNPPDVSAFVKLDNRFEDTVRKLENTAGALQSIANKIDEGTITSAGELKAFMIKEGLMDKTGKTVLYNKNAQPLTWPEIEAATTLTKRKFLVGSKLIDKERAINLFEKMSSAMFSEAVNVNAAGQE